MGGTSIKRKALRNKSKAKIRISNIKKYTKLPVIKNVDIEKVKEGFEQNKSAKAPAKKAPTKAAAADTAVDTEKE